MPCVVVSKEGPQHAHPISTKICPVGQLQTAISQRVYVVVRRDKARSHSTSNEDSRTAESASRARTFDVWISLSLRTVITLFLWCHWSKKMTSKESPPLVESRGHLTLNQLTSCWEVISCWKWLILLFAKYILQDISASLCSCATGQGSFSFYTKWGFQNCRVGQQGTHFWCLIFIFSLHCYHVVFVLSLDPKNDIKRELFFCRIQPSSYFKQNDILLRSY